VVEHSTHHPEIEGSNPGREMMSKKVSCERFYRHCPEKMKKKRKS